jgi:hypothetical protein
MASTVDSRRIAEGTMAETHASLDARPAVPNVYLSEAEFCERYGLKPRTAQRWRTTVGGQRDGRGNAFSDLADRS